MKIAWFPVLLGATVVLIRTLVIRRHDQRLSVRFSRKNDCAVYVKKPIKPMFFGRKNEPAFTLRQPGRELPDGKGALSPYWGALEIVIPGGEKPVSRTGIPDKDLKTIREFLAGQGVKCGMIESD